MNLNISRIFTLLVLIFFCHNNLKAQTKVSPCVFLNNESAQYMMNFVTEKVFDYYKPHEIEHKIILKEAFQDSLNFNHDSIFKLFFDTLRKNLGNDLFCKSISLDAMSFTRAKYDKKTYGTLNRNDDYYINLNFEYPTIKKTGYLRMKYYKDSNGQLIIDYPINFFYCNNLKDCGIIVTEEMLNQILNDWGFLKPNDMHTAEVNGNKWDVVITSDNSSWRNLSVDMQTGKISNLFQSYRID